MAPNNNSGHAPSQVCTSGQSQYFSNTNKTFQKLASQYHCYLHVLRTLTVLHFFVIQDWLVQASQKCSFIDEINPKAPRPPAPGQAPVKDSRRAPREAFTGGGAPPGPAQPAFTATGRVPPPQGLPSFQPPVKTCEGRHDPLPRRASPVHATPASGTAGRSCRSRRPEALARGRSPSG